MKVARLKGRGECSIDGCGLPVAGRGWCTKHWTRWRRYGDPNFTKLEKARRSEWEGPCAVDECSAPAANSRGWCNAHYLRWRRHDDPTVGREYGICVDQLCTVDGCGKAMHTADGYCQVHHYRFRKHGDPLISLLGRGIPCAVVGCDRNRNSRKTGLCRYHFDQQRAGRREYRRHTGALLVASGNVCALCGHLIDVTADAPLPMRPSVDHIVPGDDHRIENLRIAHQSCNAARCDRADVHRTDPPWVRNPELVPVGA